MKPRRLSGMSVCAGLLLLSGCNGFFTKPVPTPTNTVGDYLYVGNLTGSVAGFAVSTTGALTGISGLPLQVGTSSINALAVTQGNSYLYASAGASGLFVLNINSGTGALTVGNSGNPVSSGLATTSLVTESTGKFLVAGGLFNGGSAVGSYTINTDGTLATATAPVNVPNIGINSAASNLPGQIAVTPADSFVYLTMGSSGVAVFSLNTSGVLATTNLILNPGTSGGIVNQDTCIATDPTGRFLFVGETNAGLRVFTIGTDGSLTPVAGSPYKIGGQPRAIALDSTGSFVYVLNAGTGTSSNTVSAFSLSNGGVLAALNPATIAAGTSPASIVLDQSKKYMAVANSGGTPDLQIYSFDATTAGKLDPGATAATGSTSPAGASVVVGTH